ncbi:MAG: hypothetical protein KAH32_05295 [Chlamydiia bacterium]|nr:hypothetical protein [Chlamydiia bacterium]
MIPSNITNRFYNSNLLKKALKHKGSLIIILALSLSSICMMKILKFINRNTVKFFKELWKSIPSSGCDCTSSDGRFIDQGTKETISHLLSGKNEKAKDNDLERVSKDPFFLRIEKGNKETSYISKEKGLNFYVGSKKSMLRKYEELFAVHNKEASELKSLGIRNIKPWTFSIFKLNSGAFSKSCKNHCIVSKSLSGVRRVEDYVLNKECYDILAVESLILAENNMWPCSYLNMSFKNFYNKLIDLHSAINAGRDIKEIISDLDMGSMLVNKSIHSVSEADTFGYIIAKPSNSDIERTDVAESCITENMIKYFEIFAMHWNNNDVMFEHLNKEGIICSEDEKLFLKSVSEIFKHIENIQSENHNIVKKPSINTRSLEEYVINQGYYNAVAIQSIILLKDSDISKDINSKLINLHVAFSKRNDMEAVVSEMDLGTIMLSDWIDSVSETEISETDVIYTDSEKSCITENMTRYFEVFSRYWNNRDAMFAYLDVLGVDLSKNEVSFLKSVAKMAGYIENLNR